MRKRGTDNHGGGIGNYSRNMAKAIPNIITLGRMAPRSYDADTSVFYGFYEYSGFTGFFRKVYMGIKMRINGY